LVAPLSTCSGALVCVRSAARSPAGTQETQGDDRSEWRVARLPIVSRLQAALHEQTLNIANVPDAQKLAQELQDFRGVFTDTGYARFGARDGAHDDLVLAVAIGVWHASLPTRTVSVYTFYV
jgi:hypothetical protein